MRRKDREVTDVKEIKDIIEKCSTCRLALSLDNIPYIVPMCFGHEYSQNKLKLYFHCAKEGKKLDIINKNPNACFEMDCAQKLIEGENACQYSMEFESVIGNGQIVICDNVEEKRKAMVLLMKNYAPEREFEFSDKELQMVTVFKLNVDEFSAKRLKK